MHCPNLVQFNPTVIDLTYTSYLLRPENTHAVVHARSLAEAERLLEAIRHRLAECGLEFHPEKTKIVYCKDDDRRGDHEHTKFDFLGYTFRPRRAKNRWGKLFISFLPGASTKAANSIRETIRSWRIGGSRNNQSLEEIAHFVNPFERGWVNCYAKFCPSALTPVLRSLERSLVYWVRRKFKRLRYHQRQAVHWLGRVAHREPDLFVLWSHEIDQRGQDSLIVSSVCGKLLTRQDDHALMKLVGFTML